MLMDDAPLVFTLFVQRPLISRFDAPETDPLTAPPSLEKLALLAPETLTLEFSTSMSPLSLEAPESLSFICLAFPSIRMELAPVQSRSSSAARTSAFIELAPLRLILIFWPEMGALDSKELAPETVMSTLFPEIGTSVLNLLALPSLTDSRFLLAGSNTSAWAFLNI